MDGHWRAGLTALKAILPDYTSPVQMESEVGICPFFSAKRDPSKLVLTFSLLPHSPLNDPTTLMCFALEATGEAPSQESPVQVELDRYEPKAASGRHTKSMYDYFSPRAPSNAGRCAGVRAAVPPRDVREVDEEARVLIQLPS